MGSFSMARCHHRWEKSAKLWGFCRIVSPGVVYERRSSVQVRGDQAATPGSLIMGSSLTGVRLSRLMWRRLTVHSSFCSSMSANRAYQPTIGSSRFARATQPGPKAAPIRPDRKWVRLLGSTGRHTRAREVGRRGRV